MQTNCNEGLWIVEGTTPDHGSGIILYETWLKAAQWHRDRFNRNGGKTRVNVNPFYGTAWTRFKLRLVLLFRA